MSLLILNFIFCSMSMKVPTIVQEAQQALQAGYCVVIGLQSTGEVCLKCFPSLLSNLQKEKNSSFSSFSLHKPSFTFSIIVVNCVES